MIWFCDVRWWRSIVLVTVVFHASTRFTTAFRCIFDDIKPKKIVQTNISYPVVEDICMNNVDRCKRDTSDRLTVDDLFQPIRIRAYFSSSVEVTIDDAQRKRLRSVIDQLILTASNIFSGKYLH